MVDRRRERPEPFLGLPRIEHKPGLAKEMMQELAPLLAEEGIDVNNMDVADLQTLQAAMNRAVERRNMQLFTPVGPTRDVALVTVRRLVEASLAGDTALVATLLGDVVPESPDNTAATVASCIGIALGLLDDWLSGQTPNAPADLARRTALPGGHPTGTRAATDILALARKGRSFASLDSLIVRQGSPQVLAGSALALAATINTWALVTQTPPADLIETAIR